MGPPGNIQLVWHGVIHRLQCGYLVHGFLSMGLREMSPPAPREPPLPPPSLMLVFILLLLTLRAFLTPLYSVEFLPFLKNIFPEVPPPWLSSSAVSCGRSVGDGWNQLGMTLSIMGPPLTPETLCNQNVATCTQCRDVKQTLAILTG